MTSDHPSPEVWSEDADDEVEKLYATLGKCLMSFQWLEGSLDSTLLLAWGQENWSRSHQRLARMTMEKKTDAVEREVLDGEAFSRARTGPD
jgi:hypothetical protein